MNQRKQVLCLVVLSCFLSIAAEALAQQISFGAVTGVALLDDFRSGSISRACDVSGCVGTTLFQSSDDSRRLIFGASAEVAASKILSFEFEALYRPVRDISRIDYMPPVDLGNGVTVGSQSISGTDHTWEFPTFAKFRLPTFRTHTVFEFGSILQSTQEGTEFGITAGVGVEVPVKRLSIVPRLRYTRWPSKSAGSDPLTGLLTPRQDQFAIVVGFSQPASTSAGPNALGKRVSIGGVLGLGLSDAFPSRVDNINGVPASRSISDSKSPVLGLMIEFEPVKNFSIEFNSLYRPLHIIDESLLSNPQTTIGRFSVLTWEFPILAKYKFSVAQAKPFFEAGPAFRSSGNVNSTNPSRYGATGGAGVEIKWGRIRISPALRY
ncbi:MAG TPA: hypothetical protein VFO86_12800, partial [Terriglobia bacterium]|nr:hypothetical protein [Terriglobia bacterium]